MNEDDIKQENKNIPDKKTSDSQKESSDDKNELSGKIVSVQDNKEKTIQNDLKVMSNIDSSIVFFIASLLFANT